MEATANNNQLFSKHGKLTVKGTRLVDSDGNIVLLKGISSIGIGWYPEYMCVETFRELRDTWGINHIRVTMYTEEDNGYCSDGNKEDLKATVKRSVECAAELGMYAIIDWHILRDGDPHKHEEDAKLFFAEMAEYFKDYDNVFYEICNEPNGPVDWASVKSYAENIIPIIREFNRDAIIMVGTPTWSQDVDIAAEAPLDYDNILYSLHFYAATHRQSLRDKITYALNKNLPVIANEFSICDASGSGCIDYEEGNIWMSYLKKHDIGCCMWNLSRRDETSAVIHKDCTKLSGWNDDELSDIAKWYREL